MSHDLAWGLSSRDHANMTDPWDQPWGIAPSSKKVLSQQSRDRAKKCCRVIEQKAIEQKAIEQKSAIERSSKKTLLSYLSVSLMNKHNAKKKVKLKTSEQNEAHRLLKHILIILEIVDCAFFEVCKTRGLPRTTVLYIYDKTCKALLLDRDCFFCSITRKCFCSIAITRSRLLESVFAPRRFCSITITRSRSLESVFARKRFCSIAIARKYFCSKAFLLESDCSKAIARKRLLESIFARRHFCSIAICSSKALLLRSRLLESVFARSRLLESDCSIATQKRFDFARSKSINSYRSGGNCDIDEW